MKLFTYILLIIILLSAVYYITTTKRFKKDIQKKDKEFKYFLYSEFDTTATDEPFDKRYIKNGKMYVRGDAKTSMNKNTISMLDSARDIIENGWNKEHPDERIVFNIVSGHRSPTYNATLKFSVPDSAHIAGLAADINYRNYSKKQVTEMIRVLQIVGFNRFGLGKSFLHTDNDTSKPQNSVWYYGQNNE